VILLNTQIYSDFNSLFVTCCYIDGRDVSEARDVLVLLEVVVPSFVSPNPYIYYYCNMVRPGTFSFRFPSRLFFVIFVLHSVLL